jgi:hypothetical protein
LDRHNYGGYGELLYRQDDNDNEGGEDEGGVDEDIEHYPEQLIHCYLLGFVTYEFVDVVENELG